MPVGFPVRHAAPPAYPTTNPPWTPPSWGSDGNGAALLWGRQPCFYVDRTIMLNGECVNGCFTCSERNRCEATTG